MRFVTLPAQPGSACVCRLAGGREAGGGKTRCGVVRSAWCRLPGWLTDWLVGWLG
ncbi:hypothetical protein BKA81DRAFT_358245 [Phyllosticta paracitricarpa]